MSTSKLTEHTVRKRMVIKLGGSMLEGMDEAFFVNLKKMIEEGHEMMIVHGGGPAINKALADHQVTSSVRNGIRVTSKEAVDIVQATLIGQVNPALVHGLNAHGIQSIGLSGYDGNLFTCKLLDEALYGYVGEIQHVQTTILDSLLQANFVPVISCIGAASNGSPLNINADTVASQIALATGADSLLFVTDTPGIQIEETTQQHVLATDITKWIASGDIYGGMIPKVEGALACIDAGIPSVQIVGQQLSGTVIQGEGVLS
ncbi:acetylglutamate kinase [Sporosarcina sp. HYO08]|uniref:acetylglutamate kinase n=1 Tax=Sporosarcina sp. HYO08 TaxID=1759557 RepID=UPI000792B32D|nr:acetylglutamate kinase [Sporosarcina sp. HYO08]KXH87047.1 acetyl-L-glutamate 5-phosphotransferase [Sporosarcina sp. HYO08]